MKAFAAPLLLALLSLTGCSSLKPSDFASQGPQFEPDQFFLGKVRSWGVIENRSGEPRTRFSTESLGTRSPEGDVVIRQTFTYDNGKVQQRTWHVHRLNAHCYRATAKDVVGTAKGEAYGNAFYWKYTIILKPGNPFSRVHLKQWMYQPEGSDEVFTRVVIKKFWITLAEVSESFHHVPP